MENDMQPVFNLSEKNAFLKNQRYFENNPHRMLAVTHTFGLLQENFPDEYHSEQTIRFDWDKLDLYYCEIIQKQLNMKL